GEDDAGAANQASGGQGRIPGAVVLRGVSELRHDGGVPAPDPGFDIQGDSDGVSVTAGSEADEVGAADPASGADDGWWSDDRDTERDQRRRVGEPAAER